MKSRAGLHVALAVAAMCIVTGPAQAVDRPSWTGIYVGGLGGGGWMSLNQDYIETDTLSIPNGGSLRQNDRRGFFGGYVGAQVEVSGGWVLGVEAAVTSGFKTTTVVPYTDILGNGFDAYSSTISEIILVTGRFGRAWDRWLAYGKAGFATAKIKLRDDETGVSFTHRETNLRHNGWTVGAGIDYMLTPHVIVGMEYGFIRLGSRDHHGMDYRPNGAPNNDDSLIRAIADINTVSIRVAFKFDPLR